MTLFKKKLIDSIEMLHGRLVALRAVWEMHGSMPPKQQQNAIANMPNSLRSDYQAERAVDVTRAYGLIAEARNNPPRGGPAAMSWAPLLDHATA